MRHKICKHCGEPITGARRHPDQQYCGKKPCQRYRRRMWQRHKMVTDADYKANQREAQKVWRHSHGQYSRQYRQEHPGYCQANGRRQAERNRRRRQQKAGKAGLGLIAKMDAFTVQPTVCASLVPLEGVIAKKDGIATGAPMGWGMRMNGELLRIEFHQLQWRYRHTRVMDEGIIEQLGRSMASHGQLRPVRVCACDGGYVLIDG